jgi:predicted helicase
MPKLLNSHLQTVSKEAKIVNSCFRPYIKQYLYFDYHFNARTYQLPSIFPSAEKSDQAITFSAGRRGKSSTLATNSLSNLDIYIPDTTQCLPLYRYDENRNRIDNITDWALEQFRQHYRSPCPNAPIPVKNIWNLKRLRRNAMNM